MTEMKNQIKLLGVYNDGWRNKSIDDIYLQVMKENKMEGIIDFIVKDEYNGYTVLFYEFTKLTSVFNTVPPIKMKQYLVEFMEICNILMRYETDFSEILDSSKAKQYCELLLDYEYNEEFVNKVKYFLEMYDVSWDVESVKIKQLDLEISLLWIDLEDDEDDSDIEICSGCGKSDCEDPDCFK